MKKAIIIKSQTDLISRKRKRGISDITSPCSIVEPIITFVFGNKSTTEPTNNPKMIAGKYVVIATNPVICSEFVMSSISHINATSYIDLAIELVRGIPHKKIFN